MGLPHAGGGPAAFQGWRTRLPDDVDLLVAHLPGRETRLREAPPSDAGRVVRELVAAIGTGAPIVLFGHSWGAHLAFRLTRHLPDVRHLIVSGAGAPHCPRVMPPIAHLPRREFLDALAALGGIPEPVLAHEELMDALLPALRADFRLAEAPASEHPGAPLPCPITALGGSRDPLTTDESLSAWSSYTASTFRRLTIAGDHFFHVTRQDEVVAHVVRVISEARPV
ncbi:thioesterase II family protein [Goekera deserti]|uniref:Thioesterase n=1 Tax=Goekera deserti TaxID=2497753 RepID=A0A7K3WD19_9ACTN|nr:alpha/beta fold hydrolase [Goekera deserti]NDI46803.1 alpha/beta fold hydrolase [Goekera deserti]NEL54372.1 thioesterase [Goekera deserti]